MIDLKEAAKIAKDFIVDFDGEQENFRLESVLLSPDRKSWQVAYSYSKKIEELNNLQKALGLNERRVSKKVIIDNENKEIIGYYEGNLNVGEPV